MLTAPSREKILHRLEYKAQSPTNIPIYKHRGWETQQKSMWQCSTSGSGDLAQSAGPVLIVSVQISIILQNFNQHVYSKTKRCCWKKELLFSAKIKNNTGSGHVQVQNLWSFSHSKVYFGHLYYVTMNAYLSGDLTVTIMLATRHMIIT